MYNQDDYKHFKDKNRQTSIILWLPFFELLIFEMNMNVSLASLNL